MCGLCADPFGTEEKEQSDSDARGEDEAHVHDEALIGERTQDRFVLRRPSARQHGLADRACALVELERCCRKEEKGKGKGNGTKHE